MPDKARSNDGQTQLQRLVPLQRPENPEELCYAVIAAVIAQSPRLALNKTETADSLGVSVEFFDEHIAPELRTIRRGRRVLYTLGEILWWLMFAQDPPL